MGRRLLLSGLDIKERNEKTEIFAQPEIRLFLLMALVGIIPNFVLRTGILISYESRAVSNRSIDIAGQAKMLGNQVITYNYLQDPSEEMINVQLEMLLSLIHI